MTASEMMAVRTEGLREHLASLAAAAPHLPAEFRNAAERLLAELRGRRLVGVLILVLGFVALGAGTEWVFRRVTASPQRRIAALPIETASERMRAIGLRLAFGLSEVAIFGLGSIGAFLAFDWPPLLRQVVLTYLVAAVVLRLALVLGRFLLAPEGGGELDRERYRVVPLSADAARYWYRRLALFVGWFAFGRATLDILSILGFSPEARELVAYTLGLGLLAIALNVVWTHPRAPDAALADTPGHPARHTDRSLAPVLVSRAALGVLGRRVHAPVLAAGGRAPPASGHQGGRDGEPSRLPSGVGIRGAVHAGSPGGVSGSRPQGAADRRRRPSARQHHADRPRRDERTATPS